MKSTHTTSVVCSGSLAVASKPIGLGIVFFIGIMSIQCAAGELPDEIRLRPAVAKQYGFSVQRVAQGADQEAIYRITFPGLVDSGCRAGRIQVATFDSEGRQVSIASFDVLVRETRGSLTLAHDRIGVTQKVSVQYCCNGAACKVVYSIDDLEEF